MSTAIMLPISTPFSVPPPVSELSRSTATFYTNPSSSPPRPSRPFWSLSENSRTTFRVAATSYLGTSTLIDEDPDREEEDHILGIKRKNRNAISASTRTSTSNNTPKLNLSPASSSPSKRRCYPTITPITLPMMPVTSGELSTKPHKKLSPSQRFSSSLKPRNYGDLTRASIGCCGFDESGCPDCKEPTASSWERHECGDEHQRSTGPAFPEPPKFQRQATIRDAFDLACSTDEFSSSLISSS